MKNLFLTFIASLITLGSLSAQNFIGKINPSFQQKTVLQANDTLRILAVMVNFQTDKDDATFGNGKFGSIYTKEYGNQILDPLPHDKDYFESHLTFVKNYFSKVSNGKVNIVFTILPDTFSVSKTMRNYTPSVNSSDFTPLGQFAQEVWEKADQLNSGFNFSNYDVFLIFHAGVGRDISLPGSIGTEKDIPSIYLNENALKNVFGSTFDGFSVSGGTFKIKNSMIIPETESRELESISGNVLYEISINGLLVASVASHLGLPDLFDTETGLSAIGRFGLMDGQAIFAYNGLFPPEPSAWEKIYLGWVEPMTIKPGNYSVKLATKLTSSFADTVILKVPLNETEYYLIENKQRDANKDGAKVLIKSNGQTFTRTFLKDTTGFYSYDTDSLSGVILDVDEYDWALPGSGILIWHIDQNVIDEKLAENKINNDKTLRGVDVEEADGVQEIGETFITIFGDQVIGEGTAQDLWYSGNKARFYDNIFSKDSRPDTRTNSGANSLITIKDFSANSNKMSFKIEYGDSVIKPLFTSQFSQNISPNSFITVVPPSESNNNKTDFAILTNGDLLINNFESTLTELPGFSNHKVVSAVVGSKSYIIGDKDSKINILTKEPNTPEQNFVHNSIDISYHIASPIILRNNTDNHLELLFGTNDNKIIIYDLMSLLNHDTSPKDSIILSTSAGYVTQFAVNEDGYSAITHNSAEQNGTQNYYIDEQGSFSFNDKNPVYLALTKDKEGNKVSVVLTSDNEMFVLKGSNLISNFSLQAGEPISSFALGDLKNDGNNYIVLNNGKVEVYNLLGSQAENFPVVDPNGVGFYGESLIADIEGDLKSEILSFTKDGRIYAIDGGTGKFVEGFPLALGNGVTSSPIIFDNDNKLVYLTSTESALNSWIISSINGRKDWYEFYADNFNQNYLAVAQTSNTVNEFFPTNRAYNYPNPVYGGETAIRYFVSENSKINIKIFDLAGDLVSELNDNASGGFDNETIWNVSGIQSGVYLARIEASGESGKTESVVIKIAVVK